MSEELNKRKESGSENWNLNIRNRNRSLPESAAESAAESADTEPAGAASYGCKNGSKLSFLFYMRRAVYAMCWLGLVLYFSFNIAAYIENPQGFADFSFGFGERNSNSNNSSGYISNGIETRIETQGKTPAEKYIENYTSNLIKCHDNDFLACSNVGAYHLMNADFFRAYPYFIKGCKGGNGLSCYMVGAFYEEDLFIKNYASKVNLKHQIPSEIPKTNDVNLNGQIAFKYYKLGCSYMDDLACYNLGKAYSKGDIAKQDYDKAFYAYEKACDLANMKSCARLSNMYLLGRGTDIDLMKGYFLSEYANQNSESYDRYTISFYILIIKWLLIIFIVYYVLLYFKKN